MHATQKRFYTPRFSEVSAVSVRRLAWSLGVTMPKAVEQMVSLMPSVVERLQVCQSCRDKTKCAHCAFSQPPAAAV